MTHSIISKIAPPAANQASTDGTSSSDAANAITADTKPAVVSSSSGRRRGVSDDEEEEDDDDEEDSSGDEDTDDDDSGEASENEAESTSDEEEDEEGDDTFQDVESNPDPLIGEGAKEAPTIATDTGKVAAEVVNSDKKSSEFVRFRIYSSRQKNIDVAYEHIERMVRGDRIKNVMDDLKNVVKGMKLSKFGTHRGVLKGKKYNSVGSLPESTVKLTKSDSTASDSKIKAPERVKKIKQRPIKYAEPSVGKSDEIESDSKPNSDGAKPRKHFSGPPRIPGVFVKKSVANK